MHMKPGGVYGQAVNCSLQADNCPLVEYMVPDMKRMNANVPTHENPWTGKVRVIKIILFLTAVGNSPLSPAEMIVSPWEMVQNRVAGTYDWTSQTADFTLCTNISGCIIGIGCYLNDRYKCTNVTVADRYVTIENGDTIRVARDKWLRKYPASGSWKMGPVNWPDMCVGLMIWGGKGNIAGNKSGEIVRGSYCGKVPPANVTCELENDIRYEYGTVSGIAVNGMTKTEYLSINCSHTADVVVTVGGGGSVPMGGGVTSRLSINGTDLGGGARLTAPAGVRRVPVTARLYSQAEPKPGTYQGSSVLVLGYQ